MATPLPATIGPYQVLEALGAGGMGVVLRAWEPRSRREVALKLALGTLSPSGQRRFLREAEALARLRHPHVVRVHAAGEHEGQPYLVMDLVPGGNLRERHQRAPRLTPVEALQIGEALARALHAVHERDLLHRDVKPDNVLLTPDGRPLLTDFGLARRRDGTSLTVTGQVLGTEAYMAPEQAQGRTDLDARADVYALGATLYDLLCGEPPFLPPRILSKVVHRRPRPLRERVPGLDPEWERVVMACLAKEREERYPDARALADDLARCLRGEPVQIQAPSPARQLWRRLRRRGFVAPLALAAGGLIAAAGFSLWLALRDPPELAEVVAIAQVVESEGSRLLHEAQDEFEEGNFILACGAFQEASGLLPEGSAERRAAEEGLAKAWHARALEADKNQRTEADRLAIWKRAAELSPEDPTVLLGWALCLDGAERAGKSWEVVQRAIAAGSRDPRAFRLRGHRLVDVGCLELAYQDQARLLRLDPSGETAAHLQYRLMTHYAEEANKVWRTLPRQAQAYLDAGFSLDLRAREYLHPRYESPVPLDVHPELHRIQAKLLFAAGDLEEARAHLDIACEHPDNAKALALRAQVLEAIERRAARVKAEEESKTRAEPPEPSERGVDLSGLPRDLALGLQLRREGQLNKSSGLLNGFLSHIGRQKKQRGGLSEEQIAWRRIGLRERDLAYVALGWRRKLLELLARPHKKPVKWLIPRYQPAFADSADRGLVVEIIWEMIRVRPQDAAQLIALLNEHAPDLPGRLAESSRHAFTRDQPARAFACARYGAELLFAYPQLADREAQGDALRAALRAAETWQGLRSLPELLARRKDPLNDPQLWELAQEAHTRGRSLLARALCGQLLLFDPTHAGARTLRARIFLEVHDDPERALADLDHVSIHAKPSQQHEAAALRAACRTDSDSGSVSDTESGSVSDTESGSDSDSDSDSDSSHEAKSAEPATAAAQPGGRG